MGRHKVGDRVGAILGSEGKVLQFLGYGVYEGDEVPPANGGWMAEGLNEHKVPNPKLKLDNGKVVWGCQCWWGSEAAVKKQVEKYEVDGYKVVEVDMDEEIAKAAKEAKKP